MRADSILVELFGMPGVGKSALSRRVAALLEGRGVVVCQPSYGLAHDLSVPQRVARKSLHVLREVLLHPLAALRAARIVATSGQPSPGRCVKLTFNALLVSSLARQARRAPGVHLFDQGLAQAAWSIALEGRAEAATALLVQLARAAPVPELIAIVTASHGAVAARLAGRPEADSRLDRRLDSEPELLARSDAVLAGLRDALRADALVTRGVRIVDVTNERPEDLERRAEELADDLEAAAREVGLLHDAPTNGRAGAPS